MDIEIEHEARPEDVRVLEDRIYDFNVARTGISDGKLVAAFLRDTDGAAIGGLFGWTWGATCYIRYLFITAPQRTEDNGTRPLRAPASTARAQTSVQYGSESVAF